MATRRKRYSRHAKMEVESDESSASDTPTHEADHQKTMQIITRLSQKYLRTRITPGTKAQDSATTDTEQEYYGDEENSPGATSSQSDISMASPKPQRQCAYDFSLHDANKSDPRVVLSPIRVAQIRRSSLRQKVTSPVEVAKSAPVKSLCHSEKLKPQTPKMPEESNTSKLASGNSSQKQLRKRKSTTSSDANTSTSVDTVVRRSSPRIRPGQLQNKDDSSFFISPPLQKRPKLCNVQTTSTPSTDSRTQKIVSEINADDSCFGFDTLGSAAPDVSPVKRVLTPLSDYGSMSSSLVTSMDCSNVGKAMLDATHNSMEVEQSEDKPRVFLSKSLLAMAYTGKPVKKKKSKKEKVMEKAENWARKMNEEFEELENFELSIEG